MQIGLVSVTFRQLAPRRIVGLAREARLEAIEWGGDVHVPAGDLVRAREVRGMMREAGLRTISYGSYYRVGEEEPGTFAAVLETARTLETGAIRVWAGKRASKDADEDYRRRVAEDALRCADAAERAGVVVCYEFHEGTLTDTDESAAALLEATRHPAVATLWQPPHEVTVERAKESLRRVAGRLHHVHVFHWPQRGTRARLAEGEERWREYLRVLRESGRECPLMLEFVRGDEVGAFLEDARTLREWVGG